MDKGSNPALCDALLQRDDRGKVREALAAGADANCPCAIGGGSIANPLMPRRGARIEVDSGLARPLFTAIDWVGDDEVVSLLLDAGADASLEQHGATPVAWVAVRGPVDTGERLAMLDALYAHGATAKGVDLADVEAFALVESLASHGADPKTISLGACSEAGNIARAVELGADFSDEAPGLELVSVSDADWSALFAGGFRVNAPGLFGTLLIQAVEVRPGRIADLLDRGADPNLAHDGVTPLCEATVSWSEADASHVALLGARGADPSVKCTAIGGDAATARELALAEKGRDRRTGRVLAALEELEDAP